MRPLIISILLIIGAIIIATHQFEKKIHPALLTDKNRPLVTVEFQGQFGNQLFQAAAGISYALDNNCKFVLPKRYLKTENFRIKSTCKNVFSLLPFEKKIDDLENYYEEPFPFKYRKIPFNNGSTKIKGYFQSEKFFQNYKDLIIELFSPSSKIENYLRKKHKDILSHPNIVGIHIRTFYRDYLGQGEKFYKSYFPPDIEYIEKAIELFDKDSIFVVCSDHIDWCKKNLKHIDKNFVFIENQPKHLDFYLLSLCDHMITSNSSFSWWAAYLIKNKDKIIVARDPWTTQTEHHNDDIIPPNWIRIKSDKIPPIPTFE